MFTLRVTDAAGQADTQQYTLDVRAPIVVTPASLAGGTVGTPYGPVSLTATGGKTPYAGRSPRGAGRCRRVSPSPRTGRSRERPQPPGTYPFTARASDSGSPARADTESFSITVTPSSTLTISTTSPLPAGKVNKPYSVQFTATGGTGPFTWSQTSGTRPSGLNLNPTPGLLSGAPTKAGKLHLHDAGHGQRRPRGEQVLHAEDQQEIGRGSREVADTALTFSSAITAPTAL